MAKSEFQLPSFAKINLFLRVFGRRDDGMHELCTALQTVSLSDTIRFEAGSEFSLTSDEPELPVGSENLIARAARLLASEYDVKQGARVHVSKRIPFPGGLGGGSSNAAVALLGLSYLWGLPVTTEKLIEIGTRLGSDVPFFFIGGTALGTGTGSEVAGTADFRQKLMLLVTPETPISTPKAYSELNLPRLTKKDTKSILKICQDGVERLESGQIEFINDFESSVFRMKPEIAQIKTKLIELGAVEALMSGSGSSVFGIFENREKRQMALDSLSVDGYRRCYAVETVSRDEYLESMGPCRYLLT